MAERKASGTQTGSRVRRVGVAALLATVGVLSPMAWDYYQSRIQLELHHLTTNNLVQPGTNIEGLQISFASRAIPSLSQLEFVLLNTGSRPIRGADLVSKPTLRFTDDVELLDVTTQSVLPDNLQHTLTMNGPDRNVAVDFPLMNPGDRVRFTVLATGLAPEFTAAARVVGLNQLVVRDRREVSEDDGREVHWIVYVLGVISACLLVFTLFGIHAAGEEKELARLAERGLLVLPNGKTGTEYRDFITDLYSEHKSNELSRVMSFLDQVTGDLPLTNTEYLKLNALLGSALRDYGSINLVTAVFGVLALIGTIYVLWAFS